jgi:chromatin remodeling complex protein RSC6
MDHDYTRLLYVSPEMCIFLGVPIGSQVSRTYATKIINDYIKQGGLNEGRTIFPDNKMRSVMKLNGGTLTFFNMQKTMVHNFSDNEFMRSRL